MMPVWCWSGKLGVYLHLYMLQSWASGSVSMQFACASCEMDSTKYVWSYMSEKTMSGVRRYCGRSQHRPPSKGKPNCPAEPGEGSKGYAKERQGSSRAAESICLAQAPGV